MAPAMRSLQELTSVAPPFWPTLVEWIETSPRSVHVLPPPADDRAAASLVCR